MYIPYEHVVRNFKFLNVQQLLKCILRVFPCQAGANSTFVGQTTLVLSPSIYTPPTTKQLQVLYKLHMANHCRTVTAHQFAVVHSEVNRIQCKFYFTVHTIYNLAYRQECMNKSFFIITSSCALDRYRLLSKVLAEGRHFIGYLSQPVSAYRAKCRR